MTDQTQWRHAALTLCDEIRQERDPAARLGNARAFRHEVERQTRTIEQSSAYEMRAAGWPNERIASELGVDVRTVYTWIHAHADRTGKPDLARNPRPWLDKAPTAPSRRSAPGGGR